MKATGHLEIDTPLLALVVAELITNDDEKARALANRARRHYKWAHENAPRSGFYRKMRGQAGSRWLRVFMFHWLDAMNADYGEYKRQNRADFWP